MNKSYTGGCACGAIRYEMNAETIFMNHCQCRDCQHKSGTGHGSYLSFAKQTDMKLTGSKVTQWNILDEAGNIFKTRAFCPTCGSPLYITFARNPEAIAIHATSLDDPSRFKPQMVTYTSSGYAWDYLDPALPTVEKMP